MHIDLSRRITKLICAADNISPIALKSELLDLARHCQVVPGNRFLVNAVCGSLEGAVSAVFGPLAMLLVMTEPRRRQVYFAVLARLEADGAFEAPGLNEMARADLLTRLVMSRNEHLIAHAYGSCPTGFIRLIGRLGDCAQQAAIYTGLFTLLDRYSELAQPLLGVCQRRSLTDDLVELAQALPPTSLGIRAAARFETMEEYRSLMRPYEAITGESKLTNAHLLRIAEGEAPGNLLEGLYLDLPFPAPVLSCPDLTYVADGKALVHTSREFSNCVADYVAEALKGERQFYIWSAPKAPQVVFSINSEGPFGWYLSEAKLANNEKLPLRLRRELEEVLRTCGVRVEGSVERMMNSYRSNPNPYMVHEFFDFEEAA
ncbi:hypothetical protein [Roseicyclus marinus]|uniref:hypothetical protein n=1 Tax=Roseicyclus marinus TaxID=2161673 RepID=UPI00241026EF|nr:hypothetical protein [Roseicyclus marinus]MDG3039813.1 hypothetical protein [Roseicyclus marinus]